MTLSKDLLQEQDLEFTNSREDLIEVSLFRDKFNIWLNGSIIENTKSLKQTQIKLDFLKSL